MAVTLVKGGNVSLTQMAPEVDAINVLMGWKTRGMRSSDLDIDACCLMLTAAGKVRNNKDAVFYNHTLSEDRAVMHLGSNAASDTSAYFDAEAIRVDLSEVSPDITKLVFAVAIYKAKEHGQSFAQVSCTSIVLVDDSNRKLVSFELSEAVPSYQSLILGELYRYKGQWKFRAIGDGFYGGLDAVFNAYGVTFLNTSSSSSSSTSNPRSSAPTQSVPTVTRPPKPASSHEDLDYSTSDSISQNSSNSTSSFSSSSAAKSTGHSLCLAVVATFALIYLFLLNLIRFGLFITFLISPFLFIAWLFA